MPPGAEREGIPAQVRALGPEDAEEAASVLAEAFWSDPGWNAAFRLGPRCRAPWQALMRAWVEGHLRAGEPLFGVVLGDRVVGVAGVSSSPSRLRYFRLLPALVRLVPALRPGAALALLRATRRPPAIPAPALTLDKIAVLPEFQGRGLGRRLMAHVHALCASDPEPAGVYLVTVGEGNRSFYEALGYRTVRAVPAAGVTVLHMFLPRLG